VVERVAFKTTDAFAVGGLACEHQSRSRRSMSPKPEAKAAADRFDRWVRLPCEGK
jgi:hypothetical protein